MKKINHTGYTQAQLGMVLGLLLGSALAIFLLTLTRQPLSLALSVLGVWLGFDVGNRLDQLESGEIRSTNLRQKLEPLFLVLAIFLVLFSTMLDPLISAGLAIVLLILLLGYQVLWSRRQNNRK